MRRAVALAFLLAASAAHADVTPIELARVGVRTPSGAAAPMNARFAATTGSETLEQAAGGKPLVLVFADYGCTALCGPALAVTAARLRETGLKPGRDYRLAVVGLGPMSTPAQAQAFGAARLGAGSPLLADSALLVGPATSSVARALGYGYAFDPAAHQYVHPVAAFVLAPKGRVAASLSEINVTAARLRTAVAAAARGEATGWTDRLALVCHQALVAVGRFDGPVLGAMRAGAVAVLLAMAGGFAWLLARGRRRTTA